MTRSRRGRRALIARGLLLLAAILLLPLATMLQAPRESAAQSAGQDSLWAAVNGSVGVCADPTSSTALSGCFASATTTWPATSTVGIGTSGDNVIILSRNDGGLVCPVTDLGANCTRVMAGGWNGSFNRSLAVDTMGNLWIGQDNGYIYRCQSGLPYIKQDTAPTGCILMDKVGQPVDSLLYTPGISTDIEQMYILYAGLRSTGSGKSLVPGKLLKCSWARTNDCTAIDTYGEATALTLAAGGGYVWAGITGLDDKPQDYIWRCDMYTANRCDRWETAGGDVSSISYDGQGTLYAAIRTSSSGTGVIWSCPTAYADGCTNVVTSVNGWSVAAGAPTPGLLGSVFSSTYPKTLNYGTSPFTAASSSTWDGSNLLYLPADGPVGVGGVNVKLSAKSLGQKLEKRCQKPGRTARATVSVTGANGFEKTSKTGACGLLNGGRVSTAFGLLDPGDYTVTATAGKHSGEASFTVKKDRTRPVNVKLTRGSAGG